MRAIAYFRKRPTLAAALVLVLAQPNTWMTAPQSVAFTRRVPHAVVYSVGSTGLHRRAFETSPGWRSPAPYVALRRLLMPNITAQWNVHALGGYSGIVPVWSSWLNGLNGQMQSLWQQADNGRVETELAVKLSQIHGVDFILTAAENAYLDAIASEHSIADQVHVYRLAELTPDVYLAQQAELAPETLDLAVRAQSASSFVPGESVAIHASAATLRGEMRSAENSAQMPTSPIAISHGSGARSRDTIFACTRTASGLSKSAPTQKTGARRSTVVLQTYIVQTFVSGQFLFLQVHTTWSFSIDRDTPSSASR